MHDDVIKWKRFPVRSPKNARDAEPWYILWSAPEQTMLQTIEALVFWDAIALIMT